MDLRGAELGITGGYEALRGATIDSVQLVSLAPLLARLEQRLRGHKDVRPYLSPGQARLMGRFFFYRTDKAERELGYRPRPSAVTLRDTYRFWTTRRSA